jgi:hypothetical protein
MDEVVAMERAGFSDEKIVDRLRATGQVFELTTEQKNYLRSRGVSDNVISQLASLNQNQSTDVLRSENQVIGR